MTSLTGQPKTRKLEWPQTGRLLPPLPSEQPVPMSLTTLWILLGAGLCLAELFVPTAFVAAVMGVSALVVALVSVVLPSAPLQVGLWLGLSVVMIRAARQWLDRPAPKQHWDAIEGQTLTAIAPGQPGRVLYEGQSWAARCQDTSQAIAPQTPVYIVGRQGTTLWVLPIEHWPDNLEPEA
ncbi:NfeD family protein [Limnothrix sp. FACHB-1088]|uniref:NfeD family protein n=1 Tax=Limnothrix sp. FACHB-1088 TaxID=2692816 RepID=UPI001F548E22|nr:NfeD family protein [Limnothrix sp. FACHB-1088]